MYPLSCVFIELLIITTIWFITYHNSVHLMC